VCVCDVWVCEYLCENRNAENGNKKIIHLAIHTHAHTHTNTLYLYVRLAHLCLLLVPLGIVKLGPQPVHLLGKLGTTMDLTRFLFTAVCVCVCVCVCE
jgi:hypothetical protein